MAALLVRCHRSVVSNASVNALLKICGRSSTVAHNLQSLSAPKYSAITPHTRCVSSTSTAHHFLHSPPPSDSPSTTDLHSLYHDQMNEIQSEREAVFGKDDDDNTAADSPDITQIAKSYTEDTASQQSPPQLQQQEPFTDNQSTTSPQFLRPGWNDEEYEVLSSEREVLYAFSDEEKSAWSNTNTGDILTSSQMHKIREMVRTPHDHSHDHDTEHAIAEEDTMQQQSSFSHLTPQGDGVSMVDVGNKVSSRRVALARSVVVFPPEVMSAFQVNSTKNEMVGPKGPIFETAKIAGIMGAKKTSDLIPLCHPLPLDRVNINIQLVHNQAIIECECRVTHKTGVEMEALTGATIAALTIYDMIKAVSHNVEIGQTILVSKSGGKSDYLNK